MKSDHFLDFCWDIFTSFSRVEIMELLFTIEGSGFLFIGGCICCGRYSFTGAMCFASDFL